MHDIRKETGKKPAVDASQTESSGPGLIAPPPTISLPKGGGAIRGMGEKFAANPITGTGSMSVPLATSPSRSGFGPQLSLSYDSGAGNGPFGFGWSLSLPSITRKTDKGLPRYRDTEDSDVFILSGAEDLVPEFKKGAHPGEWAKDADGNFVREEVAHAGFLVRRYRSRIEGLFARIERWTSQTDPTNVFWRSISKDNVSTWYGKTEKSRIADPSDGSKIFSWLICESYDDKGNAVSYEHEGENSDAVDFSINEKNRSRSAQRYLKRIKYCNKTPRTPDENLSQRTDWLFEVVFDYGEHDPDDPKPNDNEKLDQNGKRKNQWRLCRHDPFSVYRSGFEVRTYRLCQRVLMFHHFPEEEIGADCLVRSTDFVYRNTRRDATDLKQGHPIGSFIASVSQSGYQRNAGGGYLKKSMPPLEFTYSESLINEEVQEIDDQSLENLPNGLDGRRSQWVDLDGEGLSGVLMEQGGVWFYKHNLSALPLPADNVTPTLAARFAPVECLRTIPAPANLNGGQQLLDLAGDGQLDVVEFDGPVPGFFERTTDEGWETFRSFASLPNIAWKDPNLRFVDLTGDGHADILVTEDEVFTWYPSLAEEGFGAAEKVRQTLNEEAGPRLVFGDVTQSIYLSDLSGDGLTDLVRIRNGEVCYWPNLGYGRFGAKVTMDNAPWFDTPDQFDQKRIRLADIDGSGLIDLIYLAADGVRLYFNQSGNRWSEARVLADFPSIDNLSSVQVADLLGNGTACLVWSSSLPADARRPMRYIDLMGGQKPHLLINTVNNLGAETKVDYAPSTKFYLADKYAGRPWITKLPFPVHCVERLTVTDKWRATKFSTTYSYHHGYFDGVEREFRGFGRVEQVDTENYGKFLQGNINSPYITDEHTLYQPPIKSVTWFHTGAALDRRRILTQLQTEYFPNSLAALPGYSALLTGFNEKPLSEPDLESQDLSSDEWREALRACKGMTLRQEVYELDVDQLEAGHQIPVRLFSAATHNCQIRLVQPKGENQHAVFLVTESEALSYNYELDLRPVTFPADAKNIPPLKPDPRVAHTLNLSFDEYGNIQQSIAVGYKRAKPFDDDELTEYLGMIRNVQREQHVAYTETHFTGDAIEPDTGTALVQHYRLRLPCEVETYELTGITPARGFYFDLLDFHGYHLSDTIPNQGIKPVGKLEYHELPTPGPNPPAEKRKVEHVLTLFFSDDLETPLGHGQLNHLGLTYETYKLALTRSLLQAVLGNKFDSSVETAIDTPKTAGYWRGTELFGSVGVGQWWMRSGVAGFADDAAQHFYLPERYTDPFGNETNLLYYRNYHLFIQSSTDALGNRTVIVNEPPPGRGLRFDYRVLAPAEIEDINGNRTEAYFDALGMVVAVAVKGKGDEADNLKGYTDALANPTLTEVLEHFDLTPQTADSARERFISILGNATTRFLYHFGEKIENGKIVWASRPAGACAIVREQHVADIEKLPLTNPPTTSPLQIAFECSDGMGTVLMKRSQAEPETTGGPLRWIVNGKTVLNNKGKPVKQYEPYFSSSANCCREGDEHEAVGVTPLMYYDAAGRLVRTEMPDGTFSRVEFSPWHVKTFDANDTLGRFVRSEQPGGTFRFEFSPWRVKRDGTSDTVMESSWYSERNPPAPEQPLPRNQVTNELTVTPDQRAAWLAAQHADTPALTILDSLGREVIAIAHNRVEDANGPYIFGGKNYRDDRYLTFTKLDAEGKPLWVRDARSNLVMQYISPPVPNSQASDPATGFVPCYDIAGNLLFQHSMDAGDRWMLMDAAGKPMFAWDSRSNLLMSSYDKLHRPTKQELKNVVHPDWVVVGLTQYGEGTNGDQVNNRRGKAYRSFDQSGVVTTQEFDFKGNALRVSRRLVKDFDVDTNWKGVLELPLDQDPDTSLMPETFDQITQYDALSRMTRQYDWQRAGKPVAVYELNYNERGLLVSEDLIVAANRNIAGHSGGNKTQVIKNIRYDAKGQRLKVHCGNDVSTDYTYDATNFRLLTRLSTRPGKPKLQDLDYTYDPSGNVTEILDAAVPTEFFDNAVIEPNKRYTYDALYHLIEASGREHAGQQNQGALDNWNDCPFRLDFGVNNSKAWRNYTQRFTYDSVGNILLIQHVALGSSINSWTRQYQYATDSNRIIATGMGSTPVDHYPVNGPTLESRYAYNIHGSMTSLSHLPTMEWDFTEHLLYVSRAPASQGPDPDNCPDNALEAWYRYDASQQRVRKRVIKQGGIVEERFYLGGLEWYRRTLNGALVEEIETLHLFHGEHHLLMVDQIIKTDRAELGIRNLYRYTLSNHVDSTTVEVDEHADIISYEEYHPHGTTAYQSGRNAAEVKLKRYRYTGMERDEESGFSYHGARYYIPGLGRWVNVDPMGIRVGLNVYEYAHGDPVSLRDSTGMAPARLSPLDLPPSERARMMNAREEAKKGPQPAGGGPQQGAGAVMTGYVIGLAEFGEEFVVGFSIFQAVKLVSNPILTAAVIVEGTKELFQQTGEDLGVGAAELVDENGDHVDAGRRLMKGVLNTLLLVEMGLKGKAASSKSLDKWDPLGVGESVKEGLNDFASEAKKSTPEGVLDQPAKTAPTKMASSAIEVFEMLRTMVAEEVTMLKQMYPELLGKAGPETELGLRSKNYTWFGNLLGERLRYRVAMAIAEGRLTPDLKMTRHGQTGIDFWMRISENETIGLDVTTDSPREVGDHSKYIGKPPPDSSGVVTRVLLVTYRR